MATPTPPRTYVMLEGLQDPVLGQAMSKAWFDAGYTNTVDVSGQLAWLARSTDTEGASREAVGVTEADLDRAAGIARTFGVELRDRVGQQWREGVEPNALREHLAREQRQRLAAVMMYGLPALMLHYVGPMLATGGGVDARAMVYPWLFEMLLVGWVCFVAGWPMLWRAAASLRQLRVSGELLASVVVLAAFVPSAVGVLALPFVAEPWLQSRAMGGEGPLFRFALLAVAVTVGQRWLSLRYAEEMRGRAAVMLAGFGRLVVLWIIASTIIAAVIDLPRGLLVALVLPPMLSFGAINRWSPGWTLLPPLVSFALLVVLGDRLLPWSVRGVEFEVAAGFSVMMSAIFGWSWRGWRASLDG